MIFERIKQLISLAVPLLVMVMPSPSDTEPKWSNWIAEQLHAEAEAGFTDEAGRGRVDVLTDKLAIEVEWPKTTKATESLRQASRYAKAFDREPAVIFLIGRGDRAVEKAIVSTVRQFGKEMEPPVNKVIWMDIDDPHIARVKRLLGMGFKP